LPLIIAVARLFQEGLLFAGSGTLTLHGGYDCAFTASTGFTTVDGLITIAGSAVVIMSNIDVF
jgi:hypothetical protein